MVKVELYRGEFDGQGKSLSKDGLLLSDCDLPLWSHLTAVMSSLTLLPCLLLPPGIFLWALMPWHKADIPSLTPTQFIQFIGRVSASS